MQPGSARCLRAGTTELAVRRAALDPVRHAQRRRVDRLVAEMLKGGTRFVGLDQEHRHELLDAFGALSRATLVHAQLEISTVMVLLDSAHAPFGLERLEAAEARFVNEMRQLGDDLQAALDGRRPRAYVQTRTWLKARATERELQPVIAEIARAVDHLGSDQDDSVVLAITVGDHGRARFEVAEMLPPQPGEIDEDG